MFDPYYIPDDSFDIDKFMWVTSLVFLELLLLAGIAGLIIPLVSGEIDPSKLPATIFGVVGFAWGMVAVLGLIVAVIKD